jgi:hypothetical protein
MNLNELYKPKINDKVISTVKNEFSVAGDLDIGLAKLGWKPIGQGSFNVIYANKNKSYVLKINTTRDRAFETYSKIIHKIPNIHFPKISDEKQLKIGNRYYNIYLIEKLIKIPRQRAGKYEEIFDWVFHLINLDYKLDNTDLSIGFAKLLGSTGIPLLLRKNPELIKALKIVAYGVKSHSLDLHSENFMQRQDGTVVITDPYAY